MRTAFALVLLLAAAMPAQADGRADWRGYDWRALPYGKCLDVTPAGCHAHHAKWDWKRNQWVDLWYAPAAGALDLALQLTNNDPRDDDHVCVTVLFLDGDGANIAAHHLNAHSLPGTLATHTARLAVSPAQQQAIARLEIGTRQCRDGAGQDDAVFAAVRAALPR